MYLTKHILFALFCAVLCFAQDANARVNKDSLRYVDASQFEIRGKVYRDAKPMYSRIPEFLKDSVREPLWKLGQNSAGIAIRFRTNSRSIGAEWKSQFKNAMPHMTPTGIRGLDLYCMHEGEWRFVRSGQPSLKNDSTRTLLIENKTEGYREYMLYLSLYDGVENLKIGIDSMAEIGMPQIDSPRKEKPIVFYGSSIMQGGCATRPGMASSNIIGRRLDRATYNFGFSGNAFIDYEIAHMMAEVDASVYVLDYVPNASPEMITEKTEKFVKILRDAHPDVPLIFIEDPDFTFYLFSQEAVDEITNKNKAINEAFKQLKKKGVKNIYLIDGSTLLKDNGESTVDGIHFTDLGFEQYVKAVMPLIKKVIK